jgi:protein subunit release factor A
VNIDIDREGIEISLCESHRTMHLGAHVGGQIKHVETNIIVKSINHASQHFNKLEALEMLNKELNLRYK